MLQAQYRYVHNRRNKLNADGKGLVQLEVYYNRLRRYISTGIYLMPSQWDDEKQKVKKHPEQVQKNLILEQIISPIREWEIKLIAGGQSFSWQQFDHLINGNQADSFIEFMEMELAARNDIAVVSHYAHHNTISVLKQYGKIQNFSSITYDSILAFDYWLRNSGYHQNTIFKFHKHIRHYLNRAIKKNLFDANLNPYVNIKIKQVNSVREALEPEEVTRLELLEIDPELLTLIQLRDMFLFSCFTGIRFADMQALTKDNVIDSADGLRVRFIMDKVQRPIELPVDLLFNGKPGIILRSQITPLRNRIFRPVTNQVMNRHLKDLATLAKITKVLTFHMSRHTFGSQLARIFADPYLIKDLMGHTDIRTSMVYIHSHAGVVTGKLKAGKW